MRRKDAGAGRNVIRSEASESPRPGSQSEAARMSATDHFGRQTTVIAAATAIVKSRILAA